MHSRHTFEPNMSVGERLERLLVDISRVYPGDPTHDPLKWEEVHITTIEEVGIENLIDSRNKQ